MPRTSVLRSKNLPQAEFTSAGNVQNGVPAKGRAFCGAGMRDSIYNAMPTEGVEKLTDFIRAFDKAN